MSEYSALVRRITSMDINQFAAGAQDAFDRLIATTKRYLGLREVPHNKIAVNGEPQVASSSELEELRSENERLIERGWQDEREFHRLRTKIRAVEDLASHWETTPALRRGAAARELRKAVETEPVKAYGSVSFVKES